MANIFENAYFGKAYKARNGKKALFLRTFVCNGYNCCVSIGELEYSVREDGKVDKNLYPYGEDIVSEWNEEINEEELDKLAESKAFEFENGEVTDISYRDFMLGYKTGYRKAKEI